MNLTRLMTSYPVHRAAVAGLSFGAAIIAARVLPTAQFSALMTAAFLAKFLRILNLGAMAGYFVSRYSGEGPLASAEPRSERHYLGFFLLQMIGLGVIVAVISVVWMPQYTVGAIAFFLIAGLYVLEPALRYRRNFSFSLAPEFLLSVALIAALLASLSGISGPALYTVYLAVTGFAAVAVVALAMRNRVKDFRGAIGGLDVRGYAGIVRLGGPVYLGSALFLVASSMDRLLLPLYGTEDQVAVYFLANQLAIGSMIFVTAINFVNTVNLGEIRQENTHVAPGLVAAKLRSAALVALGSYLALILGAFVLETGFLPEDYTGLTLVVLVLGSGLALFFTSNAITPVVSYFRRQMPLSIAMGGVALALAANNAWVYLSQSGAISLAAGTAMALALYGAYAILFTFSVLRRQGKGQEIRAD